MNGVSVCLWQRVVGELTASLLVVDDDPANIAAMRAVLEPLGQRIVTALSGEEALRHVLAEDFAVILLDVVMPGLDGFETARLIKSRERSSHVPIIFLTAFRQDEIGQFKGYEHGAVDFLFKPLDPDVLRCKASVFVELFLRGETIRRQQELLREAERVSLERQSELRFRRLTDLMPLCLWVARPDGGLDACNAVWTEFSGLSCERSGSLGDLNGVHPDDRDRARAAWRRASAKAIAYEIEIRLRGRDGGYRWHLCRAVPERDDAGTLGHWIATATDIDDKRRAEEANDRLLVREQEARAEAEAANRAKDDFLATLSHELRTPLSAIIGWTDILRHEPTDPVTAARALETVERNARMQRNLIDDILDVSGIIAGKLQLALSQVDLAAVVVAAVDSMQPLADSKNITVERSIGPVGRFAGDAGRLQQVVTNLIGNALKFTSPGGRVEVRLSARPGLGELTVEDSGIGITADFLPFVFDRFRQADIASTRSHGGLGLGLAIARHIVELHGGKIVARSDGVGRGATFTATIPMRPYAARASGSTPPRGSQVAPTLSGVRVLVVDDSEDVRLLIAAMLQRHGATCTLAASCDEAIAELDRGLPDVLISDIGLPREDGYSLIRRVREGVGIGLPAAALTAYASADDGKKVLDAGFQVHLTKPITQPVLVAAIAKLAGRAL